MNTTAPRRRARKGTLVARVAVVVGLAAAAGFIAFGGAQDMPAPATQSACSGWSLSFITVL